MEGVAHLIVIIGVLVAAAACSKQDDAGPAAAKGAPTAADCDRLGARTAAQSMEMTPAGTSDEQKKVLRGISDEAGRAIAAHGKADGRTAAAVACGLAATDPSRECSDKLTAAQTRKMTDDVQAIFARGLSARPPPPRRTAPAAPRAAD